MESVCVTGASGYIAGHIIIQLLETKKYKVHATVRSLKSKEKNQHLLDLVDANPEHLQLFEADLLKPESFDEAIAGCTYVLHTASPFIAEGVKDPQKELVDPALNGTINVLTSVNKATTVKRVVLTSSAVSVFSDNDDRGVGHVFTEEDWDEKSSLTKNPYNYSKVSAEKKAWEIARAQSTWTMATINPTFVVGPGSSKRVDGTSQSFMVGMLTGRMANGIPDISIGCVDVRDVAKAHLLAMETEQAAGQRFICMAEVLTWKEMSEMLKPEFKQYPLAGFVIPKPVVYVVGPILSGFLSWSYITHNVGIPLHVDNSKIKKELGIEFRPLKQTLLDSANFLIDSGVVKKRE